MEYKIISGSVVEVRQSRMPATRQSALPKRRGIRVKGNSSLRKIQANEQDAVKRLARILNCNFKAGDLWVTLRYSDDRLPETEEEAKAIAAKFLRKAKAMLKKEGKELRYVMTTSSTRPASGEKARLHHHIVMDAVSWEAMQKLWPDNEFTYRRLDNRKDYTGIARYMIENASKEDGKRRWSPSKNLKKPIYTEPIPVKLKEKIRVPAGANIRENVEQMDEESGLVRRYVRYVSPPKPISRRRI